MKLFELIDFKTVVPGLPVSTEHSNDPHVLIGEYWRHSDQNSSWWKLHGESIGLMSGLPMVTGSGNQSRVLSGELDFANSRLWLRPEEPDEAKADPTRALVLFRYQAPVRQVMATKPSDPTVFRWFNAKYADVFNTYDDNTARMVRSLMAVRAGTKLTFTEQRTLRVAGTGRSWGNMFNAAQSGTVQAVVGKLEVTGVSEEALNEALHNSVVPEQLMTIEAWSATKKVTFQVSALAGKEAVEKQAADLLQTAGFKYEEVAPSA